MKRSGRSRYGYGFIHSKTPPGDGVNALIAKKAAFRKEGCFLCQRLFRLLHR
jgi:hypothetical protein